MNRRLALVSLLLAALATGCRGTETPPASKTKPRSSAPTPPEWPALPRTQQQVEALLSSATRRPPRGPGARPKAPRELLERLSAALPRGEVFAGWRQIVSRIAREAALARKASAPLWLLWGTYHDAPLQIEAFRRLIGPMGISAAGVVLEQFDASGHWKGLSAADQEGDDRSLAAYLRAGDAAALAELQARQRRNNYTGWKYGYLPQVLDLLYQARASATPVWPCDMSRALQRRLRGAATESQLLRLRELHCALSLRARRPRAAPSTRAALWGQDHVEADGFARFLSPRAHVVTLQVFGGRRSASALARRLASRLALSGPLLIAEENADDGPLHRRWVVMLPGEALGARVQRSREAVAGAEARRLTLRAPSGSVLSLGKRRLVLRGAPQQLRLSVEERVFALEYRGRLMVGSLDLAREGSLELEVAPGRREIELRLRHDGE